MNQLSLLLLVDSDPRGLETLKYGFEREGCSVAGTSDPKFAPELARTTTPQLAVISLREPEASALDLIAQLRSKADTKDLPLVTLGPATMRAAAMAAGASDFLTTPLFFRDVISVGKLMLLIQGALAGAPGEVEIQARLSEYYGLYYLLRAISGTGRSGILQLSRGNRKGEIRFSDGAVTSAQVGPLQGFPALHHMLLWEEAALSLKLRSVLRRGQFSLSPSELLEECERFLRDFTHAARDLGPGSTVYVQSNAQQSHWAGLVPSDVGPLLRLFDGHRTVTEVIEESPFRIFDTLRVLKRLLDNGGLVVWRPPASTQIPKRISRGTGSHTPLRPPPRTTPVQLNRLPDQRAGSGDRRKSNRHRTLNTPPPARHVTPIPLTVKKVPSTPIGLQASARKQHRTPPPQTLGDAPTVQMKLDPAPSRRVTPAPVTTQQIAAAVAGLAGRFPTPYQPVRTLDSLNGPGHAAPNGEAKLDLKPGARSAPKPEPVADAKPHQAEPAADAKADPKHDPKHDPKAEAKAKLRRSNPSLTPTSAFDAIESDFFAREADLYKKEEVDKFDDLERGTDPRLRRPARSQPQPQNARKKR